MATAAMKALGAEEITAIADKGYHTGQDLQNCKEEHISTIVAYPERDTQQPPSKKVG